jgi:hypothetical protein
MLLWFRPEKHCFVRPKAVSSTELASYRQLFHPSQKHYIFYKGLTRTAVDDVGAYLIGKVDIF